MRIRNLTAESLPAAMSLVRAQMGPDAVILSTHTDPSSGMVRITAALEDDAAAQQDMDAFERSLAGIDRIGRALELHRVPVALADRLVNIATSLDPRDPATALAGALDAELRFLNLAGRSFARPLMLAGPPGAGKSSTAAKLCAHARLGGIASRMITMDSLKAGALAQIRGYAEALGAEVAVADSNELLATVLGRRPPRELAVIDTVGANPFDAAEIAALAAAAGAARADLVLVMAGGGDALDSAEAAEAFAGIGARALIATKLDLTRRLGGLLSAAHASKIPLMATSSSPHIVDGLKPINPVSLARLLLSSMPPAGRADAPTGDLP